MLCRSGEKHLINDEASASFYTFDVEANAYIEDSVAKAPKCTATFLQHHRSLAVVRIASALEGGVNTMVLSESRPDYVVCSRAGVAVAFMPH